MVKEILLLLEFGKLGIYGGKDIGIVFWFWGVVKSIGGVNELFWGVKGFMGLNGTKGELLIGINGCCWESGERDESTVGSKGDWLLGNRIIFDGI